MLINSCTPGLEGWWEASNGAVRLVLVSMKILPCRDRCPKEWCRRTSREWMFRIKTTTRLLASTDT
jgi:hypothetical protein